MEAEAESKILQGKGVAGQRRAIIEGFYDSIQEFQSNIKNTSTEHIMSLILMTQYFDMLKDLGNHSQTNTILLPHSLSGLGEIFDQIRNSIITANHTHVQQPTNNNIPDC